MKTTHTVNLSDEPPVKAFLHENGTWYLSHPGKNGETTTYSTGITGSEKEIVRYVRDAKIIPLVRSYVTGALTRKAIAQITIGRKATISDVKAEWVEWLRMNNVSKKTIERYTYSFDSWLSAMNLADRLPAEIGWKELNEYINSDAAGKKKATRLLHLNAVRNFFKFCAGAGYTNSNPSILCKVNIDDMPHEDRETTSAKPFDDQQVLRLLAKIKSLKEELESAPNNRRGTRFVIFRETNEQRIQWLTFWYAAVIISYETGLRLGDVCQLEWACFATEPGNIVVWTDKRDKRISIPLSPLLDEAIKAIPQTDARWVFPEIMEMYNHHQGTVTKNFERTLEKCEMREAGYSFHSLRHSFITRMTRTLSMEPRTTSTGWVVPPSRDEILKRVGKMVGHSSIETTKIYDHS